MYFIEITHAVQRADSFVRCIWFMLGCALYESPHLQWMPTNSVRISLHTNTFQQKHLQR